MVYLPAEQPISSAVGDDLRIDGASGLPLTHSDRPAGGIGHSDRRGRRGPSCAAAAMPGLPSIRQCRSGSLVSWLGHFHCGEGIGGGRRPGKRVARGLLARRNFRRGTWKEACQLASGVQVLIRETPETSAAKEGDSDRCDLLAPVWAGLVSFADGFAIRATLPLWQHPDAPRSTSGSRPVIAGRPVENQLQPLQEAAGRLGWTVVAISTATRASVAPGGATSGLGWILCSTVLPAKSSTSWPHGRCAGWDGRCLT
jgi:hypothetical protein